MWWRKLIRSAPRTSSRTSEPVPQPDIERTLTCTRDLQVSALYSANRVVENRTDATTPQQPLQKTTILYDGPTEPASLRRRKPRRPPTRHGRAPKYLLRIPPKILSEIFLLVMHADRSASGVISLMLVCRHWHDVTLSTIGSRHLKLQGPTLSSEVVGLIEPVPQPSIDEMTLTRDLAVPTQYSANQSTRNRTDLQKTTRLHDGRPTERTPSRRRKRRCPPTRHGRAPNYLLRIPPEILSEIFLLVMHADRNASGVISLMLVCRHWHGVTLFTMGSMRLKLQDSTLSSEVQELIGRDEELLLDVWINVSDQAYRPSGLGDFRQAFSIVANTAERWKSLILSSLPGDTDMAVLQPLQRLEAFTVTRECPIGDFFVPLLTAIGSTTTDRFKTMELSSYDSMLHLAPSVLYTRCFRHIKNLKIRVERMESPADILPFLERLESFEAHRLHLPSYASDIDLPLCQTLTQLRLRGVSIQWMNQRTFLRLRECILLLARGSGSIRRVDMRACRELEYDGALDPLRFFNVGRLDVLRMKGLKWGKGRGSRLFRTIAGPTVVQWRPSILHLAIRCEASQLLEILRLLPCLKELTLGLPQPSEFGTDFFLSLVVKPTPAAGDGMELEYGGGLPSETTICPNLQTLALQYQRGLRGTEQYWPLAAISGIVSSRKALRAQFYLIIGFEDGEETWEVGISTEKIPHTKPFDTNGHELQVRSGMGTFSSPKFFPLYCLNQRAAVAPIHPSSLFRRLTILMIHYRDMGSWPLRLATISHLERLVELSLAGVELCHAPHSDDLPLVHTLKRMSLWDVNVDWVIGRTFYVLEECSIRHNRGDMGQGLVRPFIYADSERLSRLLPIEMPICTKFVYEAERVLSGADFHPSLMGVLRLPKLRDLDLNHGFDPRATWIWKERILENINLSRIKVLCLSQLPVELDVVTILELVPSVERLTLLRARVLAPLDHTPQLFRSFVAKPHRGPPIRIDTRREHLLDGGRRIASVLCPRLRFFVIKGLSLPMGELEPILKAIVYSRDRVLRSPLHSLKVYPWEELEDGWAYSSELGSIEFVSPKPQLTERNSKVLRYGTNNLAALGSHQVVSSPGRLPSWPMVPS